MNLNHSSVSGVLLNINSFNNKFEKKYIIEFYFYFKIRIGVKTIEGSVLHLERMLCRGFCVCTI